MLSKTIFKKIRRYIGICSLAMSNVEKNALGQDKHTMDENTNTTRNITQGTLADDLLRGEVTQQVEELRYRTYAVMQQASKKRIKNISYSYVLDENGNPTGDKKLDLENMEVEDIDDESLLSKMAAEPSDPYPIELVVDNKEITTDVADTIMGKGIVRNCFKLTPVECVRNITPRFLIEKYTNKLHVRTISENEKLIEFFISKYPAAAEDRKTVFLTSMLKRIVDGSLYGHNNDMFDIKEIKFTSHRTIGVKDFLRFEYDVKKFDKVVEFSEHYLIKFICEAKINGVNLLDVYKDNDLARKYENKEVRPNIFNKKNI